MQLVFIFAILCVTKWIWRRPRDHRVVREMQDKTNPTKVESM